MKRIIEVRLGIAFKEGTKICTAEETLNVAIGKDQKTQAAVDKAISLVRSGEYPIRRSFLSADSGPGEMVKLKVEDAWLEEAKPVSRVDVE